MIVLLNKTRKILFNEGEAFDQYLNEYVYSYFEFTQPEEFTPQENANDADDEVFFEEIL